MAAPKTPSKGIPKPSGYTHALPLITAAICAGANTLDAAIRSGFTPDLHHQWMKRSPKYRLAIWKAEATARTNAEMGVFAKQPRQWLQSGPGRLDPENVWKLPGQPESKQKDQNQICDNVFDHPDVRMIMGIIIPATKDLVNLDTEPQREARFREMHERLRALDLSIEERNGRQPLKITNGDQNAAS